MPILNSSRKAFDNWKNYTLTARLTKLTNDLKESTKNNGQMEQRIVKLKALLARTHQANQRNLEEFDNMKKAKLSKEDELKLNEMKANAELNSLREAVRANSITSAFQYDIDILIQNAGDYLFTYLFYLFFLFQFF